MTSLGIEVNLFAQIRLLWEPKFGDNHLTKFWACFCQTICKSHDQKMAME